MRTRLPTQLMTLERSKVLQWVLAISLSAGLYLWSTFRLEKSPDIFFLLLLAAPLSLYFWFYRENDLHHGLERRSTAWVLTLYAVVYFASIFFLPILGASVLYWLVQFLIPIAIIRFHCEPLSRVNFKWSLVFSDFKVVILTILIVVPALVFMVRDSEHILLLFQSWKIVVYLPLSILFMLVIAAFWEEFFFRGVVMSSFLKLTDSSAAAIFLSALLFGTYHIPMRFLNERSQYYGDLPASIAATLNEQFLMGLLMGIIVYKSKNVWHAIWIHSVLNGISYVYQLSQILKI